jgi:hypothetical protein
MLCRLVCTRKTNAIEISLGFMNGNVLLLKHSPEGFIKLPLRSL